LCQSFHEESISDNYLEIFGNGFLLPISSGLNKAIISPSKDIREKSSSRDNLKNRTADLATIGEIRRGLEGMKKGIGWNGG
jgi:hypothetical protein